MVFTFLRKMCIIGVSVYDLIDFLGNRRSAVLRRIFCAGRSVSTAALLGVMQGRDTKPGAEETSKTVLRKFPRKSNIFNRKNRDQNYVYKNRKKRPLLVRQR